MTSDRCVIRRAGPADLAALLLLEDRFPGDRLSRRAFRHHLANPRALLLVGATAAGRIDGYALALRRSGSPWWRLYSLVRAAGAPKGTGRALLAAVLEHARAAGARGLRLEVRADNTPAIRLYEALGFRLFATRQGYYEDGGAALRMALDLDG